MKKLIIIAACLIMGIGGAFAQQKNWKDDIKMWRYSSVSGDILGWDRVPVMYLGATTSIGAQYDVLKLGLGTGVYYADINTTQVESANNWGAYAIPLFAIAQIDLYQSKYFTPFVEVMGGLELYTKAWNISTSVKIGVGVEICGFSVGIGQAYQKIGKQVMGREAILTLGYSF